MRLYRQRRRRTGPHESLRGWYASSLGESILEQGQHTLAQVLPKIYGYHALQVGVIQPDHDLLRDSGLYHRVVLDNESSGRDIDLLADPLKLPIGSGRVDLVVLVHTLDFNRHPHQVLREAERVLAADGQIIVIGFNPYSLWGLVRLSVGWRGRFPWTGAFYSMARVQDWLALLGFRTLHRASYFYRPPFRHAGTIQRLKFMESLEGLFPFLGAAYIIQARKHTIPLTPVRPRWRPARDLVSAGVVRPANRL